MRITDLIVDLYFNFPLTNTTGPWILDLATSKGIFKHEATVPETKPIPTFFENSLMGS